MQQLQLVSLALAMAAFVVCGWVFARKPRKKLSTLRPETDEHQPGCFALEEERGANWKGGAHRSLKKLNQVCDPRASLTGR
jgi:hypothetical protein